MAKTPLMTDDKIISAVCILPQGTQAIEECLVRNWGDLRSSNPEVEGGALQRLGTVLKQHMPEQSIRLMYDVLDGKTDQGLLFHNLPERKGFEKLDHPPKPEDTYIYHISKALYELRDMRLGGIAAGDRASHIPEKKQRWGFDTLTVHRDTKPLPKTTDYPHRFAETVIFACPYNGEKAATEIIQLRRAIESLPEDVREKVLVRTNDRAMVYDYEPLPDANLNDLLKALQKFGTQHEYFVKEVELVSDPELPETKKFLDAVRKFTASRILNSGNALLIHEDGIFHCSCDGDPAAIALIPPDQAFSRFILHFAGTPSTIR